jgi:hypothetical protein
MPTTYDSYESKVIEYALAMLINSAQFRLMVGAATPTDAKSFVVESWGGDPGRTTGKNKFIASDNAQKNAVPPYALITENNIDPQLNGISSIDYNGQVVIQLVMPRKLTGETPPESMRRARNVLGIIRDEIQAQFGTTGRLATGAAISAGPFIPEDSGADGDALLAEILINWQA